MHSSIRFATYLHAPSTARSNPYRRGCKLRRFTVRRHDCPPVNTSDSHRLKLLASLLVAALLLPVRPGFAQDPADIGQLARDGAPELAVKILDQVQPDAEGNFQGWLFFERQRVEILRDWRMWQPLIERLEAFPESAPRDLRHWALAERVNAELQLGRGERARALLRELLWQPPGLVEADAFSLYRRLVIRSYLVDDKLADARRAMLRYQQDYANRGEDWLKLQARVFLRTDRPGDAARVLPGDAALDPEGRALKLLAELRGDARAPASVLGAARELAEQKDVSEADRARLWKVAAEAAVSVDGHLTLTRALETAALLSPALPAGDALFAVTGDQLWQAYRDYAMDEGNRMQLLVGQDEHWLAEAEKQGKERPERRRAFLTVVMFDGASPDSRRQAYARFLESMQSLPEGMVLLKKLFLDTARFPIPASIPDAVRYVLVDDALARNDIELAGRLMSGLERAPEGSDELEWGLRRARVLILGGQADEGIAVLERLIENLEGADKQTLDRITQVVFDLQTVNRHKQAISLFVQVQKLTVDVKLHRELLFWQADSYKALDQKPRAALLYLKSATLLDGKGYDPWGQTARFRAAELLGDAGLVADARRIYEGLLKATADAGRRAMIRYKLQELWLKE